MNYRAIINVISLLLYVIGLGLLLSLGVGFLMNDDIQEIRELSICMLVTLTAAIIMYYSTRRKRGESRFQTGKRDGFACVTFGWLICTLFATLPFYLCGRLLFADAFFEACSGLTTTGASVLTTDLVIQDGGVLGEKGLESLSYGLLFFRSLLNWFGGVGIVFFVLIVLPWLKIGEGKDLYNAEVPGLKIAGDQLTPRLASSVKMVLGVYLLLTGLATVAYKVCGMEWYDAVCHSFSTISTGGFSTKANSIAYYDSPVLQWMVVVFMFISACNFSLIVKLFQKRQFLFHKDEEFRFFAAMAIFSILFVTVVLWIKTKGGGLPIIGSVEKYRGWEAYVRTSAFQVVSVMTTTGFVTSDWNAWDYPCILLLFMLLMFPCGCGGSTSGGMKYSRIIVIIKQLIYEVQHCLFPRRLQDVRLNDERIDSELLGKTLAFAALYVTLFMAVALLLTLDPAVGVKSAFSGSLTCIGNVGPGYGKLGPAGGFNWMSAPSKYLLSLTMIAGRLELYTVLVVFFPSFWKR